MVTRYGNNISNHTQKIYAEILKTYLVIYRSETFTETPVKLKF